MKNNLIIGIPAESRMIKGIYRNNVNSPEVSAVVDYGGIPLLIPTRNPDLMDNYLSIIDGLLIPGGADVAPRFYGEEPIPELGDTDALIDESEINLVRGAVNSKIPMFGICRGIQVINIALGGNIYQDLAAQSPTPVLQHYQRAVLDQGTHHVTVDSDSKLATILETTKILVNSHHHEAVKEIAESLKVTATSSDGVIEGIESVDDDLVMAVQWHPETMYKSDAKMARLFKDFMDRVRKYQ